MTRFVVRIDRVVFRGMRIEEKADFTRALRDDLVSALDRPNPDVGRRSIATRQLASRIAKVLRA